MKAWLCLAFGSDRQYGGNKGYKDELTKCYRYDSFVPNHKQVQEGDVLFLRDRSDLLGMAKVVEIMSTPGTKAILRCPTCRITGIKVRSTKTPKYRCNDGHEFETPAEDTVSCTLFEAKFNGTFRESDGTISLHRLSEAVLRPSDQLSIQEINVEIAKELLGQFFSDPTFVQRANVFGTTYKKVFVSPSSRDRNPFEVDPDAVDRATTTHAKLQNFLAESLSKNGIEARQPGVGEPPFDIGWENDGRIHICEVKSLTDDNEEKQLRYGLGQVLRYRHALLNSGNDARAVIFVERRPSQHVEWVALCEELNVILLWPDVVHHLYMSRTN